MNKNITHISGKIEKSIKPIKNNDCKIIVLHEGDIGFNLPDLLPKRTLKNRVMK
jgi:hypothetical protein